MALHGFLKEVLCSKQVEIAAAKAQVSFNTVRGDAEQTPAPPGFLPAMQKSHAQDLGIIAEIKKASPSKGDIRPDLDVEAFARAYTKGGAKAISVLTESRFFKGNLKDLETACRTTTLPVLRKDFIVSSYQIYEAKRAGAAAALLITTALSKDQLTDYISLVRDLDMEPLVEITSEKEFETAFYCGAKVVDINNRNLQTLETDLNVSKRIAAIIPDEVVPVEASGIRTHDDILEGVSHKMFNFLVGESIVRSDDPEQFIKMLKDGC
jgi:indole-3-glycerol phosphate synthase